MATISSVNKNHLVHVHVASVLLVRASRSRLLVRSAMLTYSTASMSLIARSASSSLTSAQCNGDETVACER